MDITEKLDQLADFQAQADYLEMQKRDLLNKITIPAEVLAAQDEANKQRQRLDSEFWKRQKDADELKRRDLAAIPDPELPPEYVAALERARKQRAAIELSYAERGIQDQRNTQDAKAKIDADLQAQIGTIYAQVETRRAEIGIEFSGKAEAVQNNITKLTAEVKDDVIKGGATVKGKFLQAVFMRGRVTWNTDMLDGMIIAFPALANARKEGAPSVTIRKIG